LPKFTAEVEFGFEGDSLEAAGRSLRGLARAVERVGFEMKRSKVAVATETDKDASDDTSYGPAAVGHSVFEHETELRAQGSLALRDQPSVGGDLRRVLPVASEELSGGLRIVSVECYADGLVVRWLAPAAFTDHGMLGPPVQLHDDSGTSYRFVGGGASGHADTIRGETLLSPPLLRLLRGCSFRGAGKASTSRSPNSAVVSLALTRRGGRS
jgi:hypothetical protein